MKFVQLERHLFANPEQQPWWLASLRTTGQVAWLLGRDIAQGRLNLYAMGLVYSTLIAIVPLLAFGVAALKGLGINGVLGPSLHRLLEPLGPAGGPLAEKILLFVGNVRIGVLGIFGILLLAFTAVSLLHKIEAGLNAAWQVSESRPALTRSVQYLSLLIVGPVFLFAAFGVTATLTSEHIIRHLSIIGPVLPVLGKLVPYLIAIAAFTLINLITPNTRVQLRAALAAGIAGGIVWQGAGQLFALLTARSTQLSAVYSSFAILILFLTWLYISWLILLLGARIGFYIQNPAWRRPYEDRFPLSPAHAEATALDIMLMAAERFAAGEKPLMVGDCVGRFGISGLRLEPVFDRLVDANLLFRVGGRGYVIARNPTTIGIAEVLDAVRGKIPSPLLARFGDLLNKNPPATDVNTQLSDLMRTGGKETDEH